MSLGNQELTDLLISWISLSVAFSFIIPNFVNIGFVNALPIAALAVGTGFLMHELAHKYVAIYFGAKAEYRVWNFGILIALGSVLLSGGKFFFAAPGAVYIFGKKVSVKENGIISLAGPAMNVVVGIIAFLIAGAYSTSQIGNVAAVVGSINFYLALFNLLPVFVLDGAKVFAWNKAVWAALFFPLAYFVFFV